MVKMKNKHILSKIARWWSNLGDGWQDIFAITIPLMVLGIVLMIVGACKGFTLGDIGSIFLVTCIGTACIFVWLMLFQALLGRI